MSNCSCVLVAGGDGPEASTTSTRKARKSHVCCECAETINRGDKHEHVSGIWNGEPSRFRTCLTCVEIRDAFFCDGWEYGSVLQALSDHLCDLTDLPCECLAQLSQKARKVVCKMIEDVWLQYGMDEE